LVAGSLAEDSFVLGVGVEEGLGGGVWGSLGAGGGAGESVRLIWERGLGVQTLPKGVVSSGVRG
jgi:hypothetical protein